MKHCSQIILFLTVLLLGHSMSNGKPLEDNEEEESSQLEEQIMGIRDLIRKQDVEGKFKKLQNVDGRLSQATDEIRKIQENVSNITRQMTKFESLAQRFENLLQRHSREDDIDVLKENMSYVKRQMTGFESSINKFENSFHRCCKGSTDEIKAIVKSAVKDALSKQQIENQTPIQAAAVGEACHRVINVANNSVGTLDFKYSQAEFCIFTFNIVAGKGLLVRMVESTIPQSRCGTDHLSFIKFHRIRNLVENSSPQTLCSKGGFVVLKDALSVVGVFHSNNFTSTTSQAEYNFKLQFKIIDTASDSIAHRRSNIVTLRKQSESILYPENKEEDHENGVWATTVIARPSGVSWAGAPSLKWVYTALDKVVDVNCTYDTMTPFGIEATRRGLNVDVNVVVGNEICGALARTKQMSFAAKDAIVLVVFRDGIQQRSSTEDEESSELIDDYIGITRRRIGSN